MHRTPLIAISLLSAAVLVAPAGVSPSAAAVSAANSCEGRTATLVGTAGPDVLIGTSGPDVIAALEGDDQISGREGDDVVCGGDGSDLITGGSGDDRLFGGLDGLETWSSPGGAEYPVIFGDLVDGGPGNDWLDLGYDDRERSLQGEEPDELLLNGPSAVLHLAEEGEVGDAFGFGHDRVVGQPILRVRGSEGPDRIWGTPYDDLIDGRGGDDVVHGLRGDDQLTDGGVPGDWGVDRLRGGPGTDSLDSGGGRDVVAGGKGGDYLSIGRGGSARGGGGGDTMRYRRAGTGCVDLMGARGVDKLYLTAAWTERYGVIPVDLDHGPLAGCGTVGGTEEVYLLPAGAKSEPTWKLRGTPGSDRVEVNDLGRVIGHLLGGDDWVRAGWGDDRLWGGSGTDIVDAGKGDDRCRGFETAFRCEDRARTTTGR